MKEWVAERKGASYKVVTNGRGSRKSRTEDEYGYRGEREPQHSDNKRFTWRQYSVRVESALSQGYSAIFTHLCLCI